MGQEAGSFYRLENKEQGKDKWELCDWPGPQSHPCLRQRKTEKSSLNVVHRFLKTGVKGNQLY